MPLVSVILPSYNHEKYISEAIESVLNQTMPDLELIVIDDASKDRSCEIIESYKSKDARIKTIYHSKNKGISTTMNDGIEAAQGKFIALSASDDVWMKNRLEEQCKILNTNNNIVVWSDSLIIDSDSKPTGKYFLQIYKASKKKKNGNLLSDLVKRNYICGQSIIFKRDPTQRRIYDEQLKYLNDYKIMVSLAERYEFRFISKPLAMYRIHSENSIILNSDEYLREDIQLKQYFLENYSTKLSDKTKAYIFYKLAVRHLFFNENTHAKIYIDQAAKLEPYNLLKRLIFSIVWLLNSHQAHPYLKDIYNRYRRLE